MSQVQKRYQLLWVKRRAAANAGNEPKGASTPEASRKYQEITKNLTFPKETTVADIGCGSGHYLSYLAQLGRYPFLLGVDISLDALILARERIRQVSPSVNVCFVVCDGEHLPLKNGAVDNVLCSGLIEYIPNHSAVLSELHRILRNELGLLILAVPNQDNWVTRAMGIPLRVAIKLVFFIKQRNRSIPLRQFTSRGLCQQLEATGFRIATCRTFRFTPEYPLYRLSLLVSIYNLLEWLLIGVPPFRNWGDIILVRANK